MGPTPTSPNDFTIVRRGYHRADVDAFLDRLARGDVPDEPPSFPMVRRGYDCAEVDARIGELHGPARWGGW